MRPFLPPSCGGKERNPLIRFPVPISIWISCGNWATLGQYCVCQIVAALASKLFTAAPFSHCVSWLSTYARSQLVFETAVRDVEVVGDTLGAGELESEDCNTFRSAAEVHGPPFASVSARNRTYRYTLDPNEICFSVASLAKLPVASGVPQFDRSFVA